MQCHLAAEVDGGIPIDHLHGSPAAIDLVVVVTDSGSQFVVGPMAGVVGRPYRCAM